MSFWYSNRRKPCRGEVYFVNCGDVVGSEQGGIRPAIVLQNNIGNCHSPTTIVAMVTSSTTKKELPTHVWLHTSGFSRPSCALLEQIRTVSLERFGRYVCTLDSADMRKINKALKVSLSITE